MRGNMSDRTLQGFVINHHLSVFVALRGGPLILIRLNKVIDLLAVALYLTITRSNKTFTK